jgi:hypothetical protein
LIADFVQAFLDIESQAFEMEYSAAARNAEL